MSEQLEALIQKWRREATNFRTVAQEMYDHNDDEEGTLCEIEANRLDVCADELRAIVALETAQRNEQTG